MDSQFVGRFKLVSSENFEEFMKTLGINAVLRKMGNLIVPVVEFTIENDVWTIRYYTVFRKLQLSFRLNEEFEEVTPDGRKVLTVFTLDDDGKLVQRQKALKTNEKDSVIIREVREENMFVMLSCENVVCKRVLKRIS